MRYRLILLILTAILIATALSGCFGKSYTFSFAIEQDLVNAQGEWILEYDTCEFEPLGLNMQYANVCCPWRFSGDFTMTVLFWLRTAADHRYSFGISLGDGTWHDTTENDIHMEVYEVGGTGEGYEFWDHDQDEVSYEHCDIVGYLPGLNRNGLNVWIVRKVGDHFYVSVNGTSIIDFDIVRYNSDWFGPNIYAWNDDPMDYDYGFVLQSVRVRYSDPTSPMPVGGI